MFTLAKKTFNKEALNRILIPLSPFDTFKISKPQKPKKRALTVNQIRQIRDLKDNGVRWNLARDCFMLSFYTFGLNSCDFYTCGKSKGGRLEYERNKTKDRREDFAFMSLKIQKEAIPLIAKYKGKDLMFRFSNMYADAQVLTLPSIKDLNRLESI